jgi:hypothetical protein
VLSGAGIQGSCRKPRGYPPSRISRPHTARGPPGPSWPISYTNDLPPGGSGSAPAALACGLGIMAGLAGRRPVGLVPEQPLVATVRHDMIDHGRRHHTPLSPARGAERVLHQVGSPRPGASGDRSPGASRSAAAGPAPPSPPPRSSPRTDGARAASRATAPPYKNSDVAGARATQCQSSIRSTSVTSAPAAPGSVFKAKAVMPCWSKRGTSRRTDASEGVPCLILG